MICKSHNSRCSSPAFQFLTLNMYFLILKKFGDNLERNVNILKNSFLKIDFEIKTSAKNSNVSTSLKSFSSKPSFRNKHKYVKTKVTKDKNVANAKM